MTAFTYRRIRKNSKEFTAAITNATDIRAYSLNNCFSGALVQTIPAYLNNDFSMVHDGKRYHIHVHSNLYFDFTVPEA